MRKLILAAGLALLLPTAQAADVFTDAMQQAYRPYRMALFATNTGTPQQAGDSVQQAQRAWQQVMTQFTGPAPAPYDRDKAFHETLAEVGGVYGRALEQVQAGQLPRAHETLEQIRELLANLRHRNQVVVYSDRMNAYHAVMERVLAEGPGLLSEPEGLPALTLQTGALAYLSQQLVAEAPAAYQADAAFGSLIQAQQAAVEQLRQALFKQDKTAVQAAIGQLKKPYAKLFVKFG